MVDNTLKYWRILIIFLLIAICATGGNQGYAQTGSSTIQGPEIKILSDKKELRLGENVTITLRVIHPVNYSPLDPITFPNIQGLSPAGSNFNSNSRINDIQSVEITQAYRPRKEGNIVIEPVKIKFKTPAGDSITVESNGLTVVVLSADAPEEGLRDIRGPKRVKEPFNWRLFSLIAALAAALIIFLVLFIRGLPKQDKTHAPPSYVSIEEEYIDKLRRLAIPDESDPKAVKTFYIAISDHLRTYLALKSGGWATAETTSEVLDKLKSEAFPDSVIAAFIVLAKSLDMVKYAKQKPSVPVMESTKNASVEFIRLIGSSLRR